MITKLVTEKDLQKYLRRDIQEIKSICGSGVAISSSGYHKDPVQTLLMRRKNNQESLFLPIIESSAIDAEKLAAGSGELFLKIFSHSMDEDLGRKILGVSLDEEWKEILENIKKNSVPARKRDLEKISSFQSEETIGRIFNSVFQKIRAGDRVLIRKSPSVETSVSRESGYCFENLGIDHRFLLKGSWTRKNVKSVLIDGVIESIGEIHAFLEEISKSKTPSVIFCVDALPDITETLIKNFLSGSLDVILVKVPVTEFHVNTLVDLGKIFGVEPVSAGTGETISLGIARQKSFADKITITRNKISIEDQKRKNQVIEHTREIRNRIERDMNLFPILEGRINSLSSSTIQVNVGMNDQKIDPRIVEKLDRIFRSLPKIFSSGFIEKNDFEGFSCDKIDLLFEKNHAIPAELAYQSIKIFLSTRETIYSAAIGIKEL